MFYKNRDYWTIVLLRTPSAAIIESIVIRDAGLTMNEGLTVSEQHEGESFMTDFSFLDELS